MRGPRSMVAFAKGGSKVAPRLGIVERGVESSGPESDPECCPS